MAVSMLLVGCSDITVNVNINQNDRSEQTAEITDDLKWWQETIAYEIYVKSFKDSDGDGYGDINGITSELDHLKDLGVGAIWLTPCYVSPQADNGYDIADYYNIDPTYGTMEDMDRLIEEADKRGIRIVMDLVFNHTSDQNEWFKESALDKDNEKSDWYIWADPKEDGSAPTNWRSIFGGSAWEYNEQRGQYYLHTFLSEQPDLNWENPDVRKALIDVADFRESREFDELSDGINFTVDRLKDLIKEAKERIDAELILAARIQTSFLPHKFPAFPERDEFELYASMIPAREVGGDFYNISARKPLPT